MSYSKSLLIFLTFFLLSCNSNADSYKVVNVANDDVLNVRGEANPKSELVGELAYNASDITLTGNKTKRGKYVWFEIKYRNIVGWVNSKYLTVQTSIALQTNNPGLENLNCNGSEPDWVLELDLQKKSIEFESLVFEKQTFKYKQIKQSNNNTDQWFVSANAINSKEKLDMSLIETSQCGDDMSDFVYKYRLTINTINSGVFSGCCNRIKGATQKTN